MPSSSSSTTTTRALPFLVFAVLALLGSIHAGCLDATEDTNHAHDEIRGTQLDPDDDGYGGYGYYGGYYQ